MPFKRRSGSRLRSVALPCGQYALGIVLRKALGIGPRILLYLALCFGLSIALTQLIFNRAPRHDESTWWSTGSASSSFDAVMDMQLETARPDDLRIVVFGGQDAATPGGKVLVSSAGERPPSWTEVLRRTQLNSSTHLSFIPAGDGSQHPMISPEIYAMAVERLLGETDPSHGPGENYSFQLDKFPIPSTIPGLAEQVTALLDTDAPGAAVPPETLWVFTFGTWEVWALATFPLEISGPFLRLMTQTIFEQADRLYETQSWLQDTPVGPTRRSQPPTDDVDTGDQRTPMFRILIPDLLDPSLLPAWKTSRPRLGRGHSKALQMRNAALLTKQWNREVHEQMDRWVFDGPGGRADGPPRDGFLFDLPHYLVDAITEGQMRKMGEPRARPAGEGYRDVSKPCASLGRDEGEVQECEAAGDRLFSTPFVAGTKAVRDIGTLAAEVVRNNESQRASGRYVPPPRVGAWFERWDLRLASRRGETKR